MAMLGRRKAPGNTAAGKRFYGLRYSPSAVSVVGMTDTINVCDSFQLLYRADSKTSSL